MDGKDRDTGIPDSNSEDFRDVVERYHPVLMGYLRGKVRSYADREDIVQETFLSAYRNWGALKDARKTGPWLIGIAKNKAKDFHRNRQRGDRGSGHSRNVAGDVLESVPDAAPGPRQMAETNSVTNIVNDAIDRLSDKYRVILYLRLIHGHTVKEVAEHLNLTEGAVRVRLTRGLKQLRKSLERRGIASPGHDRED